MNKILAIDDNTLFLYTLLICLEQNGMQTIGAQNGQLGLQLAKEQIPDLIICDIRMPEVDGYEVLKIMRQDSVTNKIPLIFLTAEETDSQRRRAMELGANDYLNKYCTFEELIKAIKAQLEYMNQNSRIS